MMRKKAKKDDSDYESDDDFKPGKAVALKAKKPPESKPASKKPSQPVASSSKIKDEDSDEDYIKPAAKKSALEPKKRIKDDDSDEDDFVLPATKKAATKKPTVAKASPASDVEMVDVEPPRKKKPLVLEDSESDIEVLDTKSNGKVKESSSGSLKRKRYVLISAYLPYSHSVPSVARLVLKNRRMSSL